MTARAFGLTQRVLIGRALLLITLTFFLDAGIAHADLGEADVLAVMKHQADAVAALDVAAFKADWIDGGSIIDDLPPHIFIGPGFQEAWFKTYQTDAATNGLTNIHVGLGKPQQVRITGDFAYAVMPASFSWVERAKHMTIAVIWTFVLKHTDAGWRISAWAIGSGPEKVQ